MGRQFSLCRDAIFCMVVLFALVGAGQARGEKVRIGFIDPIDGCGVPVHLFAELQKRLSAVDASGALGNVIHLSVCHPEQISNLQRSVEGACGRPVHLPDAWSVGSDNALYRGVACGPYRPESETRDELLGESPEPWGRYRYLVDSNLPNDVIARIDDQGNVEVGCDWNADLKIGGDERFTLPAEELGQPRLFQRGDAVLMMQAVQHSHRGDRSEPVDHIQIRLWTITGTARDHRRRWDQSPLSALLHPSLQVDDFELVWLDIGGLMPADIGASMHAAKRLGCDVVLVNMDSPGGHPTDMAQLLAHLSHETGVPVVVNQRTTVSPDFLVHPARTSIPDVAEFLFEHQSGVRESYGRVVGELLSNLDSLQEVVREELGTDPSMQPVDVFSGDKMEIRFERFKSVGESKYVVARVPLDAVDGQLRLNVDAMPIAFSEATDIRFYDVRGRRISGSDHGNGVHLDRAPSMEVPLSRGGYLIAPKEFFWRGKTGTLTDPGCSLRWTTEMNPVLETNARPPTRGESIRLISGDELPETLRVSEEIRLARLTRHPESEIPAAVLRAASHLLDRGPLVRSWWYRAAPRHGSIHYRPVFQEVGDQLSPWDDSHLQYWTFQESGWLGSKSGRMGDLGLSTAQAAWILLQAAAVPSVQIGAPQLVQSLEGVGEHDNQVLTRTFHQSSILNPSLAGSGSVWVDEYKYRKATWTPPSNHADILWSAIYANENQGPAVRWVRSHVSVTPATADRDWLWYYDHDATADFLQQRILTGSSPSEVLQRNGKPDDASDDLVSWRCHLLSLDQPSIRKQHLDQVITAAETVLRLCEKGLGGLPLPEDPYRRGWEATIGSGAPGAPEFSPSEPASKMPTDPAGIQMYAWAADASYRKVRAIGYRELPDVVMKHPVKDMDAQNRAFESAFNQLCGIVNIKNYRFALALVRYERRRGNPFKAYDILWRNASEGPAMPWYFKKERDLWTDAGWEPLRRLGNARWFLREANQPVMH